MAITLYACCFSVFQEVFGKGLEAEVGRRDWCHAWRLLARECPALGCLPLLMCKA